MGKNKFSKEQQLALSMNPYVKKVSESSITYSEEFKEIFQREYNLGKLPSTILIEMDIDPHVLGALRVASITRRNKKYSMRPNATEDLRGKNSGRPRVKKLTPEEELKRLKHKVALLEQENKFLKKTNFSI